MHIDIVKTMYSAILILSLTITLPHYGPVKKAEACRAGVTILLYSVQTK